MARQQHARRATLRRALDMTRSGFGPAVAVLALMSGLAASVSAVAILFVSELAWAQRGSLFAEGALTAPGVLSLVLQVGLPAGLVLAAIAGAGYLATAAVLAGTSRGTERGGVFSELVRGGSRTPAYLGALALAILVLAALVVLAPVVSVVGIVGLVARAGTSLWQVRTKVSTRWPSWRWLVTAAIPFGLAAALWMRFLLVLPVSACERHGPVATLRRSNELVRGRGWRAVAFAGGGALIYAAVQAGIAALAVTGLSPQWISALLILAQLTVTVIPIALLVAVYLESVGGRVPPAYALPVPILRRSPFTAVVAGSVAGALVVGLLAGAPVQPAWAEEDPASGGVISSELPPAEPSEGGEGGSGEGGAEGGSGEGEGGEGGEGGSGGTQWWYPGISLGSAACAWAPDATEAHNYPQLSKPPLSFCVDALGDESDSVPGDGWCETAVGTCTLRAAVEENNTWRPSGISRIVTANAGIAAGTVLLASPISITMFVTIDGGGLTIDGANMTQLFRYDSPAWNSELVSLTLRNGYAPGPGSGAAVEAIRGSIRLSDVTLQGNHATSGASALWAHGSGPDSVSHIAVDDSRFINNTVPACHGVDIDVWSGTPTLIDVADASCAGTVLTEGAVDTSLTIAVDPEQPLRGGPVRYTIDIRSVNGGGAPLSGTVTLFTGAEQITVPVTSGDSASGQAVIDASAPGTENYLVRAVYSGSEHFRASQAELEVETAGATSSVTLAMETDHEFDWLRGHPLRLVATVDSGADGGVPTGTVTFFGGEDELGEAVLGPDGTAVFDTTITTEAGESHGGQLRYGLRAVYSGDDDHSGAEAQEYLALAADHTQVSVTPSVPIATPGESVTFTARVASLEPGAGAVSLGSVRFTVGVVDQTVEVDAEGVAQLTLSNATFGTRTVSASYQGAAGRFRASTTSLPYSVTAAVESSISFQRMSRNPSWLGDEVTYLVSVHPGAHVPAEGLPAPTGLVRVSAADVVLAEGLLGAVSVPNLGLGTHDLRVEYLGDQHYLPDAVTVSQSVERIPTRTAVLVSAPSSVIGEAVDFSVEVRTNVTGELSELVTSGSVRIFSGAELVTTIDLAGGNTATASLPPALGTGTIRAVFDADARFAGSESAAAVHQVSRASAAVTLTLAHPTVAYAGAVETIVTVAGVAPSTLTPTGGTVQLLADGIPIPGASSTLGTGSSVHLSFDAARLGVGTHMLQAAYSNDPWFVDRTSDLGALSVTAHIPAFELAVTGTGSSLWSESVRLDADIEIPWVPDPLADAALGTVEFVRLTDGVETSLGTVAVTEQMRRASLEMLPAQLPIGAHSFVARFTPSDATADRLSGATSDPVPHRVEPVPASLELLGLDGIVPGESFVRSVTVREHPDHVSGALPAGTVQVTLDGVDLGLFPLVPVSVAQASIANVTFPSLGAGSHAIDIAYVPGEGDPHAAVERQFSFTVGLLAPVVSLEVDHASIDWDDPLTVRPGVTAAHPWLPEPRGTLVVSDGELGGASCTVSVAPDALLPETGCQLVWPTAGTRTLHATFVPDLSDASYESAVSAATVQVTVRHRHLTLDGTLAAAGGWGLRPTAGDAVRAGWTVWGAESGQRAPTGELMLTASPAGSVPTASFDGCETGIWMGACDFALSMAGAQQALVQVTLSYPGDERYAAAEWSGALTPRECVVVELSVSPAGAGTLSPDRPYNCGEPGQAATGFAAGTELGFVTQAVSSGEPSFDWKAPERIETASGSDVLRVSAAANWASAAFRQTFNCATVLVQSTVVRGTSGSVLLPGFEGAPSGLGPAPNCPLAQAPGSTSSTSWFTSVAFDANAGTVTQSHSARYLLGTELNFELAPGRSDTQIYDFRSTVAARVGVSRVTVPAISQASNAVNVTFGPTCYPVSAVASGPGSLTLLNAPNCAEPRGGTQGWFADTLLEFYAQPEPQPAKSLSFVREWMGADGSFDALVAANGSGVVAAALARHNRLAELGAQRGGNEQVSTLRVRAGASAQLVSADFGVCHAVGVRHGLASDGMVVPDVAAIDTTTTCPHPRAALTTRSLAGTAGNFLAGANLPDAATAYFEEGTEVTVSAPDFLDLNDSRRVKDTRYFGEQASLAGWVVVGSRAGQAGTTEPSMRVGAEQEFTVSRPLTLQPRYSFAADCRVPVTLYAVSKDVLRVTATPNNVPSVCASGGLEQGPDLWLTGTLPGGTPGDDNPELRHASLTIAAEPVDGMNPLIGWQITSGRGRGQIEVRNTDGSTLMSSTPPRSVSDTVLASQVQLPLGFTSLTAKAIACQQIEFQINVRDESGRVIEDYEDESGELLMVHPAPNCPFAPNAWIAGTQVELWAFGNPLGFAFTGWSGEVDAGSVLHDAAVPRVEQLATEPAVAEDVQDGSTVDESTGFDDDFAPGVQTTVTLDGRAPSRTIAVNYDVQCADLSLQGYAGRISFYPEPNCPGFEGQVATKEYSNDWLLNRYGGTQEGQSRNFAAMRKMAGPSEKSGRFIQGTEVLIQTRGVSDRVWTGWRGDVVEAGRINPAIVYINGDSRVENTFRSLSTGEKFESFGSDVAIFGKKIVGFGAAAATEYLKYLPPLGVVMGLADVMSMAGMILEAAGVSPGDVAWLHYTKQLLNLPFAVLGCVGTWGMGASSGTTVGGAGLAAEAAKQRTYRITNISDAASQVGATQKAMAAGDTGAVMAAKLKFYQGKLGLATLSRVTGPVLATGMVVFEAVEGGSVSWDSDASSAWGDWSGYTDCLQRAVPGFVTDAIGGGDDALRELATRMGGSATHGSSFVPAGTGTLVSRPRRARAGAAHRRPQARGDVRPPSRSRASAMIHRRRTSLLLLASLSPVLPLGLAGCAPQADWDGSARLASSECLLAAQLFLDTEAVAAQTAASQAVDPLVTAVDPAALAEALRPYVLEELHPALDVFAQPRETTDAAAPPRDAAANIAEVERWGEARDLLHEWAVIVCGPEVSGAALPPAAGAEGISRDVQLPTLEHMQVMYSGEGAAALMSVSGAQEPVHAVALCEEARASDPHARIEVKDADGFPLAFAEATAGCAVDPLLLGEVVTDD